VGPGIEDALRSSASTVLITGNAAFFIRVLALEASRAASSASIRAQQFLRCPPLGLGGSSSPQPDGQVGCKRPHRGTDPVPLASGVAGYQAHPLGP
jgi:hypothetical protein